MKKGFSYAMIPIMIIAVVIIVTGYFTIYPKQISSFNSQTFSSEDECEKQTKKDCSYVTCDYVPAGKTYEEVCGREFKPGWVITPETDRERMQLSDTAVMEQSRELARQFVLQDETYMFDGVQNSLEFEKYGTMTCINCWIFVFKFNCGHSGYGNRNGQILAQVITPHTAYISVSNGKIISAILDKKWDMITERTTQTYE
ncbi:MAG: hypothetical protein AB1391_01110 [Candidatus Micrarchaeota archaeon]